jgi:hypothetical protein
LVQKEKKPHLFDLEIKKDGELKRFKLYREEDDIKNYDYQRNGKLEIAHQIVKHIVNSEQRV